ncbi:MAG: 50S ribosome-binding GTPase [Candidatus Lokiarchaeota archaeon]
MIMKYLVGIVGKPSSGKSTFLNAACLTDAKVSELPFTTIDPNQGIGYVKTKCVCKEFDVKDNPQNSYCRNGFRFIPIELLDVAGLVPDAHKGKGLGNKFLNDLSRADALLHIIDITGSLDKMGQRISPGENDPYEDITFLENEINFWFKDVIQREDWNKFTRQFLREKKKFVNELHSRLSGLKINDDEGMLSYISGSNSFEYIKKSKLKEAEISTLNKIKEKILDKFGSTGIQDSLNYTVFEILDMICVYPVSDINNLTDNNNNILPDVFLVKKGTNLKDFINDHIHSDLAKNFIYGIDARTKKRLSDDYELKHNDVIKVVYRK